ncbi:MAG TPA: glycosyltransferase [Calditrichia bacterium]|nr:glycosyltransferase [Calditrichia bacterium]
MPVNSSENLSLLIAYGHRPVALRHCLASIRAAGFGGEIVVVDMYDDQPDIAEFGVRYLALGAEHDAVFHKSRCLNAGVEAARGTYISILDCDMIMSPGWVEGVLRELHPTRVLTTPVIKQDEAQTARLIRGEISREEFRRGDGQFCRVGRSQITLLRQHLRRRPFREVYRGWGAEDSDMNLQLAQSFAFADLPLAVAHHHMWHPRFVPNGFYQNRHIHRNRRIYAKTREAITPRMGIYVAAYHSSPTLRTHLEKIAAFTETDFDYYIADNSSDPAERAFFRETLADFPFATVLNSPSAKHGDTLQYLVESTANEIVVLFDADCFPLKPWDLWALENLRSKEAVGILSHVASREIDYHLHPSFLMFRRSLLTRNGLDLRSGQIAHSPRGRLRSLDPAGKITTFLQSRKRFNPQNVKALLPTAAEVPFQEPFQWGEQSHLRRGFGVTYDNLIFHFWYSRHFRNLEPIYDDHKKLAVDAPTIEAVIRKFTAPDPRLPQGLKKNFLAVPSGIAPPAGENGTAPGRPSRRDELIFQASQDKSGVEIDLLMLTYERREYTMMTLASLREVDCGVDWSRVRFTILDNHSRDDSLEAILAFHREHPGLIDRLIRAPKNLGAEEGLQHFVAHYAGDTPFVGKIDNDSLFSPLWLKKLLATLEQFPGLGIAGAQEYPGQGSGGTVIRGVGEAGYIRSAFVGGRFLARRAVFNRMLARGYRYASWTRYQKFAIPQWESGWCLPEAIIEHVGDWRFSHPLAIDSPQYRDYYHKTGRAKKMVFPEIDKGE